MSLSFQHLAAELRVFCGKDSLASLPRELVRGARSRAVAIVGRSVSASPAMQLLRDSLGRALVGESVTARSNSPLTSIIETARNLERFNADCVIAVGGGSAAVTARAASILLAEKAAVQDICTKRFPDGTFESPRLTAPKLPQFIIATTPSTAFVKAGSAIRDEETGERLALFDPKTRVRALFLHPQFLDTTPAELIQSASLNTLSTAVEAFTSTKCDPISEAILTHSLKLIAEHLNDTASYNTSAREHLVLAAILCGRGTEHAGGGLASVLAHAIGAHCGVANGIVNAIVLPHVMRFNAQEAAERFVEMGRALGGVSMPSPDAATNAIHAIESLLGNLPIPRRLREIGVSSNDLSGIASAAMSDWFITRNSRRVTTRESVLSILRTCW